MGDNGDRGPGRDAMDEIVEEVRGWLPGIDVTGLPITGRILRLARFLEAAREDTLDRYGLTLGDFDMLATMRRRAADDPIKIKDLQRSLMLSSGGTTKRIDRLEGAGLIDRHPDPNDRRGTLIALTEAGRALIDDAVPAVTRAETALVGEAIASGRTRSSVEDGLRRMLIAQEAAGADGS